MSNHSKRFLSRATGQTYKLKRPPAKQGALLVYMADRTGLEPATSGVTGRHSNQLNYRSEVVGGEGVEPPTFAL